MNNNYGMEIVRTTELAALSAGRLQGFGNKNEILNVAREAIATSLGRLNVSCIIKNDRFSQREEIFPITDRFLPGSPAMDLMIVALEAAQSAADGKYNASAFSVVAKEGTIQSVPNLSMYKIVVGPQVGHVVDINQPPTLNIKRVARALKKYTENVTVCILDQARHRRLIHEVKQCGARIRLITEGEISGCLAALKGEKIDIFMGYGYAPEGVLVAAAIRCLGGYFEGKIYYENDRDRNEAEKNGIKDHDKIFRVEDLISSKEVAIAATGVTDGEFLEGVHFTKDGAVTHSFVARGETHTYRKLETRHFFDHKPVF